MRLWPFLYYSRIICLFELGQTFCSSSGYVSRVERWVQDALCVQTNFPSKYALSDVLRKVVLLDAYYASCGRLCN